MMKNKFLFFVCSVLMAITSFAAQPETAKKAPVFFVPELPSKPALDGKDSPVWDAANSTYGFYVRTTKQMELRRGRTLFGTSGGNFYLRIESELPPNGARLLASQRRQDSKVWHDDSVELWIAPAGKDEYYQLTMNPLGTVYDLKHYRSGKIPDETWTAKWKKVNFLDKKRNVWVAEFEIPVQELDPSGKQFKILVSRNWKRPANQTPFIVNEAPFNDLSRYATFVFVKKAPAINIKDLGLLEKQLFDLNALIRNNSGSEKTYEAKLHFFHGDMPETTSVKKLTIAPGKSGTIQFHDDGGRIHLRTNHIVSLTVKEGEKVVYSVKIPYKLPFDEENRWKIRSGVNTNFQFAIYPYLKKGTIRFDAESGLTHAVISVKSGNTVLSRQKFAPLKKENICTFALPKLQDGTYELELTMYKGTVKIRSSKQSFLRKVFPWENNNLGITDVVYPPFKDLKVSGNKLKSVMTEFSFDGTGLYSSVKPAGEEILNGKLTYHFSANGNAGKITKSSGRFTKQSAAECIFEGVASTDAGFRIRTVAKTEYDGCTRYEMTLLPDSGKKPVLDTFHLDIPLDDSQIRLLHVIKSGHIRTNPAVYVPKGEGVIWRSSEVSNGDFFGNMHIYIWLGEVERGLSWFADNDRYFSVDEKKPVQELIRQNGKLILRVHFVNKALKLDQPRTIVFGMQPSPVKPMPSDWRKPKLVIPPHGGSNAYWGIRPAYAGKYPVKYDWEFVDRMVIARKTGKIDAAYIESFIQKHYSKLPKDRIANYRAHARGGHYSMMAQRGKQPTMLYLEEHCQDQTTPEWAVFQDEWGLNRFTPRKWLKEEELTTGALSSAAGIGITPTKSYQDFVMWYAREWLKRGIGIYCDNSFPRNSLDPLNSNAYQRPDGTWQPSSDIWDMREYHKRLWVLTKQMQPSVEWPLMVSLHITNAMILPIVCWTDIQLDLEWGWASGYKPFPTELLEIETTGRQIGAYPQAHFPIVGCGLVHEDPTYLRGKIDEAMVRTDWAMRMIYGVLRYDMRGENFTPMNKIVNDFGLGTNKCQVFDYWRKNSPVIITPEATVKNIVLRNGNQAILILASWNEKPTTVKVQFKNWKIRSAAGTYPAETYSVKNNSFELKLGKYGMQLIKLEVK